MRIVGFGIARNLAALAVLAASTGACDNGAPARAEGPSDEATVTLSGRTFAVSLVLTEAERRHGAEGFAPLAEGRGYLMVWPRERAIKLEPYEARASFGVLFLDREGTLVDRKLFAQRDREGIMPKKDAAYALFVRPELMKNSPFKEGDKADFSEAVRRAKPQERPIVKLDGHTVYVELSLTEADRQQGLMFRTRMGENEGMLFAYGSDGERQFWMGNTFIPLDIAFFNSEGTLVNVNETPIYADPLNPPRPYPTSDSAGPARFVLETNRGWFRKRGLIDADGKPKPGLKVEFPEEAYKAR